MGGGFFTDYHLRLNKISKKLLKLITSIGGTNGWIPPSLSLSLSLSLHILLSLVEKISSLLDKNAYVVHQIPIFTSKSSGVEKTAILRFQQLGNFFTYEKSPSFFKGSPVYVFWVQQWSNSDNTMSKTARFI